MQKKSLNSLTELSQFALPSSRPRNPGSLLISARLGALGGGGTTLYKKTAFREENPITELDLEGLFQKFEYPPVYHNTPGESPEFVLAPPEKDATPILLFGWDKKLSDKAKNSARALSELYSTITSMLLKLNAIAPGEYGELSYEDRKIILRGWERLGIEDPTKQAARLGFFADLRQSNLYPYPKTFLKKLYLAQTEKPKGISAAALEKERSEIITELSSKNLTLFIRKLKEALKKSFGLQGSMRYTRALDSSVLFAQKCLKDESESKAYFLAAREGINRLRKKAAREAFASEQAAIYEGALSEITSAPADYMDLLKKNVSEPVDQETKRKIAADEDESEDEGEDEYLDEEADEQKIISQNAYALEARKKMQDYKYSYYKEKIKYEEQLERRISENTAARNALRMEAIAESYAGAEVSLDDYFNRVYPGLLISRGVKAPDAKKVFGSRIEELVTLKAEAISNANDMLKRLAYLDAATRFLQDCSITYIEKEEDLVPKLAADISAIEEKLSNIAELDVYDRASLEKNIAETSAEIRKITTITNLYFDDREATTPESAETRPSTREYSAMAKGSFFEGRRVGSRVSEAEEFEDITRRSIREGTYLDDYIETEALKEALKTAWVNLGLEKKLEQLATKLYYLIINEKIGLLKEKTKYSPERPSEFLSAPDTMRSQIDADIIAAFVRATDIHPPVSDASAPVGLALSGPQKSSKKRDEDSDESDTDESVAGEDNDEDDDTEQKKTKSATASSAFIVLRGIQPFYVNRKILMATIEETCPQIPYPPVINGTEPAVPSLLLAYYKLLKARTALICAKFAFVGGNKRISAIASNTTDHILKILSLNEINIDTQKVFKDISDFVSVFPEKEGSAVSQGLESTLLKYKKILEEIRDDAKSFQDSREFFDSIVRLRGVTGSKKRDLSLLYKLDPQYINDDVRKLTKAYKEKIIRPSTIGNKIAAAILYGTFAPDVYRIVLNATNDVEQTKFLMQEMYAFAFLGDSPGILGYKEKAGEEERDNAAKYLKSWMARQALTRKSSLEKESGRKVALSSGIPALVIKRSDSEKYIPLYTVKTSEGGDADQVGFTDESASKKVEYVQITEQLLLYRGAKALSEQTYGDSDRSTADMLSDLAGIKTSEDKNKFISAGYDSVKHDIFVPLAYNYDGKPLESDDLYGFAESDAFISVPGKYLPSKITGKSGGAISKDISPRNAEGEPVAYNAYITTGLLYTTESLLNYSAKAQKFLASAKVGGERPRDEHEDFLATLRPRKTAPVTEVEKFLASRTESAGASATESEKIRRVLELFLSSVVTKKRHLEGGSVEEKIGSDLSINEEGELTYPEEIVPESIFVQELFSTSGDRVYDKLTELTLLLIENAAAFGEIGEEMELAVRLYREKMALEKDKDLVRALIKKRETDAKSRAIVGPKIIREHIAESERKSDFFLPGTNTLPSEDKIRDLLQEAERHTRKVWKAWLDEKYPNNTSFPFYREDVTLGRDSDAVTKTPSAVALAMFKDHTRYVAYAEKRRHRQKLTYNDFEYPSEKMQKYKPARLPAGVYYLVETPIDPDNYSFREESSKLPSIDNMPVELRLVMEAAPPPVTVLHKDLFIKEKTPAGRVITHPRFCLCVPRGSIKRQRPILYDRSEDIFSNLGISPPDEPLQRAMAEKKLAQSITLFDFGRIGQRGAASLIDEIATELLYDMDPRDERGTRKRIYAAYLQAIRAEAAVMQPLTDEIAEIDKKIARLSKKIREETQSMGVAPDAFKKTFQTSISAKEDEKAALEDRLEEITEKVNKLEYEMGYK